VRTGFHVLYVKCVKVKNIANVVSVVESTSLGAALDKFRVGQGCPVSSSFC